jgi:type II secretory pathway component PulK
MRYQPATLRSRLPSVRRPPSVVRCQTDARLGQRLNRRGVVLLAVLFVLVVLSLAAYQFSHLMTSEAQAASSYMRSAQARSLAESGVNQAAALLSDANAFSNVLNSNPFSNQIFQGSIVQPNDNPSLQGRFSIIAPVDPDNPGGNGQGYRYGVTDETGKININALMQLDPSGTILHNILFGLPYMTEEIANSIIDYIDADTQPRSGGAEDEYYSSLSPPYHAKNAPLDSLDELLLVKGVTPQLLYGSDVNRNGIIDPDEDDSSGLGLGWSAYLTVYSRERNVDSQGNARIYVNGSDLNSLYQQLGTALNQDMANYILAYRLYGPAQTQQGTGGQTSGSSPSSNANSNSNTNRLPNAQPTPPVKSPTPSTTPMAGGGMATGSAAGGGQGGALTRNALGDFSQGQPKRIASLFELINSQVSIPSTTPNTPATLYPSPLNDPSSLETLLPQLLDKVTTVRGTEIPARINVATAPSAVLAALPGIAETDIGSILGIRPSQTSGEAPDTIFQTPAWLITRANMNPKTVQALDPYITSRSQVYRVQSVGYFDGGGPTARIEAVIDTNGGRPRIIYWRDLTELGKGFNLQNGP